MNRAVGRGEAERNQWLPWNFQPLEATLDKFNHSVNIECTTSALTMAVNKTDKVPPVRMGLTF